MCKPHGDDASLAARILAQRGLTRLQAALVAEGGGIEVDGDGTALCSESCIINDNRNPGMTKDVVERALMDALGVRKVIWIQGIKGLDVTDGHVDGFARFAQPGVVVVDMAPDGSDPQNPWVAAGIANKASLEQATDAKGRALRVVPLVQPTAIRYKLPELTDSFARARR